MYTVYHVLEFLPGFLLVNPVNHPETVAEGRNVTVAGSSYLAILESMINLLITAYCILKNKGKVTKNVREVCIKYFERGLLHDLT